MVEAPGKPEHAALKSDIATIWSNLPDWMQGDAKAAAAGSKEGSSPMVRYWWPQEFLSGKVDAALTPGVVVHEDQTADLPDAVNQRSWRRWIWLYNTLQALPGMLMVTKRGLEARDYEVLNPKESVVVAIGPYGKVMYEVWAPVLESVVESIRDGADALAKASMPRPDGIGYEYADESGEVMAEAELAWTVDRLAIILDSQREYEGKWTELGWDVIVAEGDWPTLVMARLKGKERV